MGGVNLAVETLQTPPSCFTNELATRDARFGMTNYACGGRESDAFALTVINLSSQDWEKMGGRGGGSCMWSLSHIHTHTLNVYSGRPANTNEFKRLARNDPPRRIFQGESRGANYDPRMAKTNGGVGSNVFLFKKNNELKKVINK